MKPRKNLINCKFGDLRVLELDEEKTQNTHHTYWKCVCEVCGTVKSFRSDRLKARKDCGECRKILMIGQQYERLTILAPGKIDKNGHRYWICQCQCGNIKEISDSHLVSGKIKSCGCLLHEKLIQPRPQRVVDLTGQIFGKLTAISYRIDKGHARWLCQCECGNYIEAYGFNLTSGSTRSCGCMNFKSFGEQAIQQFLINHHINFKSEYSFTDLKCQNPLRFDFAIFNNDNELQCLIEYQGIQHYEPQSNGWGDFQRNVTDPMKRNYCQKLNIPLYEIAYDENIEEKLKTILL